MYYFTEVSCVITELWMIHMFLGSFFPKRDTPKWHVGLVYLLFGSILTVLSLIDGIIFFRTVYAVLGVAGISLFLFRARPIPGIISGMAFCAIFAVTDILAALIFQSLGVSNEAVMSDHTSRSFYLVVCHIVMFGVMMLVCLINRSADKQISLKILLPVTPCWGISLLLCFLLTWQRFTMDQGLHPLFVFVLLGLLYTSILVIFYTKKLRDQAQEKEAWEIAEHHYAMQQEYYDQLRSQQEETRALWHDISKYLRASQAESSGDALDQVQQMLDSITCVVDVDNKIVSVILNEYLQTAKNAKIQLELDVQVPPELFVTAADLYVLIGNTLDNAIEACTELPEERRKIHLTLRTHNSILFYEISNPFDPSHDHRSRGKYHGFGLKNVKKCVDKYSGKMDIQKDTDIFQLTAHLNRP